MEGNIFTSLMNVVMGILVAAIILPITVPSISVWRECVLFFHIEKWNLAI